jgi:hypothetical protein
LDPPTPVTSITTRRGYWGPEPDPDPGGELLIKNVSCI